MCLRSRSCIFGFQTNLWRSNLPNWKKMDGPILCLTFLPTWIILQWKWLRLSKSKQPCLPWELFDGENCVYFQDTCPKGTRWNGTMCASIVGDCPNWLLSSRKPMQTFPSNNAFLYTWNNNKCTPNDGKCPYGTVGKADSCQPYSPCQNGQVWNSDLLQCSCPKGTGWSGKECVVCGGLEMECSRWLHLPSRSIYVWSQMRKSRKLQICASWFPTLSGIVQNKLLLQSRFLCCRISMRL